MLLLPQASLLLLLLMMLLQVSCCLKPRYYCCCCCSCRSPAAAPVGTAGTAAGPVEEDEEVDVDVAVDVDEDVCAVERAMPPVRLQRRADRMCPARLLRGPPTPPVPTSCDGSGEVGVARLGSPTPKLRRRAGHGRRAPPRRLRSACFSAFSWHYCCCHHQYGLP